MKDKSIYNNKNFGKEFPKPGVPADEAWEEMHKLLIKNNLTGTEKKDKRRLVVLWIMIFLVLGIGVSGYLLVNNNAHNKIALSNMPAKKESKTNDHSVIKHDSVKADITKSNALNNPSIKSSSVHSSNINAQKSSYPIKQFTAVSIKDVQLSNNDNKVTLSNTGTINNKQQHDLIKDTTSITAIKNNVVTSANPGPVIDTSSKKNSTDTIAKRNAKNTSTQKNVFHFGLQWNADFSLKNNNNYFDAYNGGSQYYMWLLPSAWAKFDITKKHGVLINFNPYKQQFTGSQTVHIEKPWIASVEPDIVTRIIKTRAINVGLNYMYQYNTKLSLQAGIDYAFIQNVLYKEQSVDEISGDVLSEKIYGATHKDASFGYIHSSYTGWNIALQYNFSKLSVGAGISKPFKNLSADSNYTVRPLNGSIYLRYWFK